MIWYLKVTDTQKTVSGYPENPNCYNIKKRISELSLLTVEMLEVGLLSPDLILDDERVQAAEVGHRPAVQLTV